MFGDSFVTRCLGGLLLTLMLGACAASPRSLPAPSGENYQRAEVVGFEGIRFYGDEVPPHLDRMVADIIAASANNTTLEKRIDLLALSGGADDGAYGAGFLKGWSDKGDRPEFTLVTGVSTGALMAPFAFLGSDYDGAIKRFYTETSSDDVVILRPVAALLGASSIGDSTPLKTIIEQEVDSELVEAIAREQRRGRTLMIGTTNLDAQRPMVWDIGAIANSGHPGSTELIQKILLASASIPGAFPPIAFDVTIDGQRHQELHGDGGVTNGVFAYPYAIPLAQIEADLRISPVKTLWIIRNTKLAADFEPVDQDFIAIAGRAVSTLIKYQGRGEMIALERLAERDNFTFRLTAVPAEFNVDSDGLFDTKYMAALYDVGYAAAKSRSPWQSSFSVLSGDGPGR